MKSNSVVWGFVRVALLWMWGARWASGLYVVHLQTEKEVLSTKFVKE
ncbi:MAG: T9SS type A sorting domain-containing protein [Bacteroidetes bacterium]|nr:T9SS type A sorting domain-containing protein [Bacteroidota bacterium]